MATVTVIIPTFNRKTLLLEALESVFAQTYKDYEVLVVDDGSADGTQETLAPYRDRLRYIWKANGGEASARNRGIREAKTAYVAFLDSDDLWDPIFLETAIRHLDRNPELGLVSTGCEVFPEGERRPRIIPGLLQGDLFSHLFNRNFITASAVVAKRDCFQRVGLFDERLDQATDYDMWLRIAKAYPIAFLNQPLCRWRRHSGNISDRELRHRQCVLQVVSAHFDSTRIPEKAYRRRHSQLCVSMGRAYLNQGRIQEAKACFREAIHVTPWRLRPWQGLWRTLLTEKCNGVLRRRPKHR